MCGTCGCVRGGTCGCVGGAACLRAGFGLRGAGGMCGTCECVRGRGGEGNCAARCGCCPLVAPQITLQSAIRIATMDAK